MSMIGAAAALVWSCAACAQTAEPCERRLMDSVGSLPDSVSLVIGARGLETLRTTPAVRAAAEFAREFGLAPRSFEAWASLSRVLEQPAERALDELLGTRALLAFAPGAGADGFALLTVVSTGTEERVRQRLDPVPREIEGGRPMLALENGAFELVTTRFGEGTGYGGCAAMLVVPRAAGELTERMLPVLEGRDAEKPLSSRGFWPSLARGSDPSLAVLILSDKNRDDFAFASVAARSKTISAEFTGTAPMVLSSPIEQGLLRHGEWPARAVDLLSRDARLFVAGYTQAPSPENDAGAISPATLLHRAISVLKLPPEVAAQIEGVAIFSVGEGDSLLSAAIPAQDLAKFAPAVDTYARRFTRAGRDRAGPAASLPHESIRVLTLGDDSRLVEGGAPVSGAIAWCFTRDPRGGKGGWWTLSFRTGERADEASVNAARELNEALLAAGAGAKTARPVFRMSLKPARLVPLLGEGTPSGAALRWLDAVESSISLDGEDHAAGTLTLQFNTSLLAPE